MSIADEPTGDPAGGTAAVPPPLSYQSFPPPPGPPPRDMGERIWDWLTKTRPQFHVGTLRYTGFGLIMIFIWLLWGDFCYSLLDQNIPELLPLKLNDMGASDTATSVLNKTIAYGITFVLAPAVSVRSDRTRTRWGRRIPYLFWSTPFVGLFLVLIGCYDSLTNLLTGGAQQVNLLGMTIGRQTMSIIVIGAMMVGWDLANIFVSTIYYYLFNDVVPTAYLSRFLALFRIVFSIAGMAYNHWVFPHGLTHFRTIFVVAGIAYVVGFMLMCIFVREGSYPPPPPNIDRRPGLASAIQTYGAECFTHRLYWFFFLSTACTYTSRLISTFVNQRYRNSLGLTMQEIGDFNLWVAFISLFLQFPAGWLSDRFHPLRIYLFANIWYMFFAVAQCLWMFHDFGPRGNLLYLYITGLSFMPLKLIAEAAELPMYMRLLPKDRYGQFCSANGMVRALAVIIGSIAIGMFIGSLKPSLGERRFTWIAAWQLLFQLLAALFLILLYRQWKLNGGDKNYVPPMPPQQPPAVSHDAVAGS